VHAEGLIGPDADAMLKLAKSRSAERTILGFQFAVATTFPVRRQQESAALAALAAVSSSAKQILYYGNSSQFRLKQRLIL
jgi:hypothetical protein